MMIRYVAFYTTTEERRQPYLINKAGIMMNTLGGGGIREVYTGWDKKWTNQAKSKTDPERLHRISGRGSHLIHRVDYAEYTTTCRLYLLLRCHVFSSYGTGCGSMCEPRARQLFIPLQRCNLQLEMTFLKRFITPHPIFPKMIAISSSIMIMIHSKTYHDNQLF